MPEIDKQSTNMPPLAQRAGRQDKRQARAQQRARVERRKFFRQTGMYTGVILIFFAVGYGLFRLWSRPPPGELVANLGNQHIALVDSPHAPYNSVPPTSGPHIGTKAPAGVHTEQIPDELQLHNLEDGDVIIHYDPAHLNPSALAELVSLVGEYRHGVILEPYIEPSLPSPIVLTAWRRIDKLDSLAPARIRAFIKAYRGIDHHAKTF